MKKLILIILIFISSFSYAQDITYLRSVSFNIGEVLKDGNINFFGENPSTVLIELQPKKVVIHSNEIQTYRTISNVNKVEDIWSWDVIDNNGIYAKFILTPIPDSNYTMVMISYSDFAWYYVAKRD